MSNAQPVTYQIRYTLDLTKLGAFESYARTWIVLIERYGGIHHGYFIPRASPDGVGMSFPGLGYDGSVDLAVAMFTFPDEDSYRRYRERVAADPECQSAARSRDWLLHSLRAPLSPVGARIVKTGFAPFFAPAAPRPES
jgi:hypothetical protein